MIHSEGAPAAASAGVSARRWPSVTTQILIGLLAGIAVGLAVGTKLTVSGPAAVFAVALLFVVPASARWKAFGIFIAGVAATAGFWPARFGTHRHR